MIRHAAAAAVVVCLTPAWLAAQSTQFTVTSTTATVHKGPSTGAAVIGEVSSGTVLTVTRELGSWVKISWPAGDDGAGYMNVSWGRISHGPFPVSNQAAAPVPASGQTGTPGVRSVASGASIPQRGGTSSPSPTSTTAQGNSTRSVRQAVPASPLAGTPTAHRVGIGGRMGSPFGVGGSARASLNKHFGIQFEVSRYAPDSVIAPQQLTSTQFAPSLLYSLPDKLTDYLWIRPYLGAGLTVYRATLTSGIPGAASVTDSHVGRQLFGGAAVAFASAPRFTLSVDYGYRWSQTPLAGAELGGRGLSLSGHWYVK